MLDMDRYKPEQSCEGIINKKYTLDELRTALLNKEIIEIPVHRCDNNITLESELGLDIVGRVQFSNFEFNTSGKSTKPIAAISKVGKTIKVMVKSIDDKVKPIVCELSRVDAQKECYNNYISKLSPGDIIDARITHVEKYGAFCDIGCGIIALLPVENVCSTKIQDLPEFLNGFTAIKAIIKTSDNGVITLSHKELLGNWENEVAKFKTGETVIGVVRRVEDYGVFVELTPNLVGLAESFDGVKYGDSVTVFIRHINPAKMKVKLSIINNSEVVARDTSFDYIIPECNKITEWVYSPSEYDKQIKSVF